MGIYFERFTGNCRKPLLSNTPLRRERGWRIHGCSPKSESGFENLVKGFSGACILISEVKSGNICFYSDEQGNRSPMDSAHLTKLIDNIRYSGLQESDGKRRSAVGTRISFSIGGYPNIQVICHAGRAKLDQGELVFLGRNGYVVKSSTWRVVRVEGKDFFNAPGVYAQKEGRPIGMKTLMGYFIRLIMSEGLLD